MKNRFWARLGVALVVAVVGRIALAETVTTRYGTSTYVRHVPQAQTKVAAILYAVTQDAHDVARNLGIQEGRYMMPEWFDVNLKPGYNWVVVKVATPAWVGTYRREWGAKLQVFRKAE